VTAAQAAAITRQADAARLFDHIERRALFAADVGTSERTLRLHDLFREALLRRLAMEPGLNRQELLRRAAQVEADPLRKIEFLTQAQAWPEASCALADHAPDALLAGAADPIERLIQSFPKAQRETLPALLYADGLVALSRWQWGRIPPLMKRAAALWSQAGNAARAMEADSLIPLALAGLGENRSAQAHLATTAPPNLTAAARLRRTLAESWLLLAQGALGEVSSKFSETVDILVTTDAPPFLWQQAQPLAAFIGLPGARGPLLQWVQGALRRSHDAPTSLRGMAIVLRGWLLLRAGDVPGAWAACEEAEGECLWLREPDALAFQLGLLQAQLLASRGRGSELEQHMRALLDRSSRVQDRQHRGAATGLLLYLGTRFASQAGHAALALDLGNRLLKEPEAVGGWIQPNALFGIHAIVAECKGSTGIALTHWRHQLSIEGSSDLFGQGAEARLHAAALWAVVDGPREAAGLLKPLLDRCTSEGEPGVTRFASPQARRLLAELHWRDELDVEHKLLLAHGAPTDVPGSGPGTEARVAASGRFVAAGLSSRELEVLSRLAAGASNKHIAREFDLSPFTVKRHVGNILNKLNLASRGQAAAWFREHGGR
jgi:LuxR family maltose regulon positive regulatory protein